MSEKNNIRIDKAGAFRVRSGEAKAAKITPRPGPAPEPRTPMPAGKASKLRELHRKSR